MNVFARLIFIVGCIFSGVSHSYSVADSFRFPLDNYSVGCNPYWGECVQEWHLGEDAGADATTSVKAIANGLVKEARIARGYGGLYVIEHTLVSGQKVVSVTGHLNFSSFTRKAGDEVQKGDVLGEVGTSGQNGGWLEHVHLGIHKGAYGSGNTCGDDWIYAGYTSCSFIRDEWYDPSDFIRGFSSGSDPMCSRLNSRFTLCWKADADNSCLSGKDWTLYDFDTASTIRISDNRYCPVISDATGGGSTTPPIAGTDNSGNLPNLVMRDVYLLDADKHRIPSIRIREKGYCHMNVANIGTRMAKEKFENRCWLSDGLWFDGKDNAIDLGKEDMENLDDGKSRSSNEDFFAPEWPGTYNLVGCTDASKKEKESNEKDNCNMGDHGLKKEYVFQVTSSPDLATIAVGTINGRSVFDVNEPFGIFSTTFNQGENYGEKYASVGYFVDGNLVGQNQIRRDNMKGGYSKIEELTLSGGIATAGSHEIKICIDFIEAIAETDETNNCLSFAVTVRGSDAPVPCQVITPGNWNEWQGLGYAPPFTESGKQVLNAFCERGNPNSLKVTVGYAGSTQLISYLRGYVEGGSGVFLPQTLTCAGRVNGDWCDGVATFEVSGPEINTMTAIKPTKFYGATCEVVNNAWECSGWRLGAAVQTGSQ